MDNTDMLGYTATQLRIYDCLNIINNMIMPIVIAGVVIQFILNRNVIYIWDRLTNGYEMIIQKNLRLDKNIHIC